MIEAKILREYVPPWKAFPEMKADELSRYLKQGTSEAWFDQQWRPFWSGLTEQQRQEYLNFWNASPEWRDAIEFHFAPDADFDVDTDARESEEYLAKWHNRRND